MSDKLTGLPLTAAFGESGWSCALSTTELNHRHLKPDDCCFSRFSLELCEDPLGHGRTAVDIVYALKRPSALCAEDPDYARDKQDAIGYFASEVSSLLDCMPYGRYALIPAITSHAKTDPEYDDRLVQVCTAVEGIRDDARCFDVLDLFWDERLPKRRRARRDPKRLASVMSCHVDPELPEFDYVFVVDDVLTTGGHFSACRRVVEHAYPDIAQAYGIFLARAKSLIER